jgi:hypothetical protein
VCGKHFKSEDFREPVASYVTVGGKKVRLLAHQAVPSIFPHVPASSQLAKEREERLAKRRKQQEPGMWWHSKSAVLLLMMQSCWCISDEVDLDEEYGQGFLTDAEDAQEQEAGG